MTRPYYVADTRERDMVTWDEADGVLVIEHESPLDRAAFWAAWVAAGGRLVNLVLR